MKLTVNKNDLNESPELFLRQAGYSYINDRRTGNDSFVRRLTRGFYPRFHAYLNETEDKVEINLHLDQKQPSYRSAGVHAHSGEYDGELVAREAERLKGLLSSGLCRNQ